MARSFYGPLFCHRCGRQAATTMYHLPVCAECAQFLADQAEARMNQMVAEGEAAEDEAAYLSDPDHPDNIRKREGE